LEIYIILLPTSILEGTEILKKVRALSFIKKKNGPKYLTQTIFPCPKSITLFMLLLEHFQGIDGYSALGVVPPNAEG
jgi:hypothetical protein